MRRTLITTVCAGVALVLAACSAGATPSPQPTANPNDARQPGASNGSANGTYTFTSGYAELELEGDVDQDELRLALDTSVSPHWGPDDTLLEYSSGSTVLVVAGPAYTGSRLTSVGPDDMLSLTLTIDGSVFQAGGAGSLPANKCNISFDPPNAQKTEAKVLCQELSDASGTKTIDIEGEFEGTP